MRLAPAPGCHRDDAPTDATGTQGRELRRFGVRRPRALRAMVAMGPGMPVIFAAAKRDLEAMVDWGRQRMMEGAYEAAVQHFTDALELKPGLMQA